MIKIENLCKRYNGTPAVDKISFEIQSGEMFGLLGPNGAGKTTTINMMVGVLLPDDGSVEIDGIKDPTQKKLRRQIGNAPQSLAIYDELTVEENLTFFARLYNLKGSLLKERTAWALEFSGLNERCKSRAKTLSGGMQRRLNFACALVHDPKLLILDEPTVGVDPQSRNMMFDRIEQLSREGRTIIYTTHYMEEAQRLCDRVGIIDNGKILDIDTVDGLIEKHGGRSVVKAELASLPDNKESLPGELDGMMLRFDSDIPLEDVARLSSDGVKFRKLRIDRPDLESVFLNLTGRRLRD